jgi:Uma2 family endonuclease
LAITIKLENDVILDGPYLIIKENVSEDDFWVLANEDIKCELLEQVLFIHSPASPEHEDIFSYLITIFRYYLDVTKQGKVFGSRLVMRLSSSWNPEPDILLIAPDKYNNVINGRLEGPADFVIEILSPSTSDIDLTKKVPEYLKNGVTDIWIIDPINKVIRTFNQTSSTEYIDSTSDNIIPLESFPKLELKIKWIWQREDFSTNIVLSELLSTDLTK